MILLVITEHSIRFELAKEDSAAVKRGEAILMHKDSSPSLMVFQGIQIEKLQCVFLLVTFLVASGFIYLLNGDFYRREWKVKAWDLGPHATKLAKANWEEAGHALLRCINSWMVTQHLYLPQVATMRKIEEEEGEQTECEVEDVPLLLPSSIATCPGIDLQFFQVEMRYRQAQASSALAQLRGLLLSQLQLWNSKKRYSHGQGQNTRSHALIGSVQQKINDTVKLYCDIHQCMRRLGSALGTTMWESEFPPLRDDDIRGLSDDFDGREGYKGLTWIWMVQGAANMEGDDMASGQSSIRTGMHYLLFT
jgi:hypothetical protein